MFPHLFSPFTIRNCVIPNRIFSTGHDTMMAVEGKVSPRLIAYHEARARGGAGLIVSQVAGIHETARYTSHILMATEDECIEGFSELARRVKAHGTRIFGQLFHPGREMYESSDGSHPMAYAPSAVPNSRFHVMPMPLSRVMIAEIVNGYAAGARRLQRAGYDGCEIVASQGYLVAQFLNAAVNQRDDEYGGPPENRLRFLREVFAAVRAAVGEDFVIGLRISLDEKEDTGLETEEIFGFCRMIAADGVTDYFNVIAGTSVTHRGAVHIVPPMTVETGYLAPLAARLKREVPQPVFVAGRINQPQIAEGIVARGEADLCGMTRALITDPRMPEKARAGRPDDIRACIGCNQACIGHFQKGYPISCIQYPETGREFQYGSLQPAKIKKRVFIAGGGPAGMKAAAVLAARGHAVTLYEKAPQLGGQVLLAQLVPGRAEFGGLATNLAREMELAGVAVKRGEPLTAEVVRAEKPDAVIVATGATPRWPEFEGRDEMHTVDAWAVLSGAANVGQSVVIADWRCDWVGLGLAQKLAQDGCKVTLCVEGLHAGETIPPYVRDTMNGAIHKLGVTVIPYARLFGADRDTVYFQHTANGEPIMLGGVDTLVLSQGQTRHAPLAAELEGGVAELHVIGDALTPRTAEEAVLDGLKLGAAL